MTPVDTFNSDDAILAGLGYKQEFKRSFRPFEVFGLLFSFFGMVPSIAALISISMSNGGSVSMVWGWAIGSCFVLCIGMAIAELASSAPTAGGLYYLTYTLSSPKYRVFLCWIVGYANTIAMVTAIASGTWACTIQIAAAVIITTDGRLVLTSGQLYGIYAAIVVSQATIASLGTKILARAQTVYAALNVLLCLVVIIALPIATPAELRNPASHVFGDFTNFSGWPDGPAFILGLLPPLWSICCYDIPIHISEESRNAATAAPWGIVSAIVAAGVLGWLINVMLALCMGPDISAVLNTPVNQPMIQIFLNSFGRKWTMVVWSFVILFLYMLGISGIVVASRQSFAFARDGALPLSNLLYRINPYTGTPVNTIVFDSFLALLVGLLSLLDSAAINAAFTASVAAFYVAYIIPISSRFIFKKDFKPGPFSLGMWSAPVAAVAVAFMLFMLIIFCFPTSPDPHAATMNYSSLVLGGVLLLAVAWYYMPVYGGVHWFRGPAFNVEVGTSSGVQVDLVVNAKVEEKIGDDGDAP